jgi:hypothetical protein
VFSYRIGFLDNSYTMNSQNSYPAARKRVAGFSATSLQPDQAGICDPKQALKKENEEKTNA